MQLCLTMLHLMMFTCARVQVMFKIVREVLLGLSVVDIITFIINMVRIPTGWHYSSIILLIVMKFVDSNSAGNLLCESDIWKVYDGTWIITQNTSSNVCTMQNTDCTDVSSNWTFSFGNINEAENTLQKLNPAMSVLCFDSRNSKCNAKCHPK